MLTLTKWQQEAIESNARIKLIMGAERSGKTTTLIKALEREMKKLNSRETRVVIFEFKGSFARMIMREISWQLKDIIYSINKTQMVIETTYGVIEIRDYEEGICPPDIVAVDTATRFNNLDEIIKLYGGIARSFIIAGHCPKDINNYFYKAWASSYYGEITGAKAFKLKAWDNPALAHKREELEKELLPVMGLERYVRDYFATII